MADEKQQRRIVTRAGIEKLKEDRKNDPAIPVHDYPRPSWMDNADDTKRIHTRMRERYIRYGENRLEGAKKTMEREFDQNN